MTGDAPSPTRDELVEGMREIRTMTERQREDMRLWEEPHPSPGRPYEGARFSPSAHEDVRFLCRDSPTETEKQLRKALRRLHQQVEQYTSFLDGGAVVSTREWFVLGSWGGKERGMIPRDVVEAMGIDCSAEDRGGTTVFSKEQAERLHAHNDWQPFA
jgi:hypothetical protein